MKFRPNRLFSTMSIGTNVAMGYSLEQALSMLSDIGAESVELSSIAGMCEHVDPRLMDEDYGNIVSSMLAKHSLSCFAVSGHVDISNDDQCKDLIKKIYFAKAIGATFVNTNSGPLERMAEFQQNIKKVIVAAELTGITVCLESHGDIIGTAKQSASLVGAINHPLVRMNYDTGNTYFYEKGKIKIEEDIQYSFPYLSHIHLKDICIDGDVVNYCPLGQGDLNFPAIFKTLQGLGRPVPCTMEIPVFVGGTVNGIGPRNVPLTKYSITSAVEESWRYLNTVL